MEVQLKWELPTQLFFSGGQLQPLRRGKPLPLPPLSGGQAQHHQNFWVIDKRDRSVSSRPSTYSRLVFGPPPPSHPTSCLATFNTH